MQQPQQRKSVQTDNMMENPIACILVCFVILSVSHAQGNSDLSIPPSSLPTSVDATSSIIPSVEQTQSPSVVPYSTSSNPTATNQPTSQPTPLVTLSPTNEICRNHPDFVVERWDWNQSNCTWNILNLTCDDQYVSCDDYGNLGPATDYCCKCKFECMRQCNDPIYTALPPGDDDSGCFDTYYHDGYYGDDYYLGDIPFMILTLLAICGLALCARLIYNRQGQPPARRDTQRSPARRDVLRTMTARRQQQRENNTQGLGLAEEERNNARYELFVTKFYFQAVLPDRSNVTANSLRSSASNPDEEYKQNDGEGESSTAGGQPPLSNLLSNWRRPSAKDECCICLERYTEGETICAPITTECNHVFHEGCILEWLKTKDHCPLCRVELLRP